MIAKAAYLLKALFSEGSGVSSMRVMSFMQIITAAYLAIHGLDKGVDLMGLAVLVGVFVTGAMGGKVAQKFAENKQQADPQPGAVPPPPPPRS